MFLSFSCDFPWFSYHLPRFSSVFPLICAVSTVTGGAEEVAAELPEEAFAREKAGCLHTSTTYIIINHICIIYIYILLDDIYIYVYIYLYLHD